MERIEILELKFKSVVNSLTRLQETVELLVAGEVPKEWYDFVRTSEIKSFEFTLDTLYKYLKEYLNFVYEIEVKPVSPKSVFRKAHEAGIVSDDELLALFEVVDARNLAVHSYNLDLAQDLSDKMPGYAELLQKVVARISPAKISIK